MLIKKADLDKIHRTFDVAGISYDPQATRIRDGILWLRIGGNSLSGKAALRALHGAGINQVIDSDFETDEAKVIWALGAEFCTVWIDFVDHEPLFRE